jgi:hypothetical protein
MPVRRRMRARLRARATIPIVRVTDAEYKVRESSWSMAESEREEEDEQWSRRRCLRSRDNDGFTGPEPCDTDFLRCSKHDLGAYIRRSMYHAHEGGDIHTIDGKYKHDKERRFCIVSPERRLKPRADATPWSPATPCARPRSVSPTRRSQIAGLTSSCSPGRPRGEADAGRQ